MEESASCPRYVFRNRKRCYNFRFMICENKNLKKRFSYVLRIKKLCFMIHLRRKLIHYDLRNVKSVCVDF